MKGTANKVQHNVVSAPCPNVANPKFVEREREGDVHVFFHEDAT